MTKQYSDLIKRVVSDMASFPPAVLVKAKLRDAAREFCDQSHALKVDFDFDTVVDQRGYLLLPSFDAMVKQVYRASRRTATNVTDGVDGSEIRQDGYDVFEGDASAEAGVVVTCAALDLDAVAFADTGATLNDLPVHANADNSFYLFCGFDTDSGIGAIYYLASAAEYANALNGALPQSGYYLPSPYDDLFGTYEALAGSTGSATVAPTQADGVAWRFEFRPGRAPKTVVADGLRVKCVMVPGHYADGLPVWFMNRYSDALVAGARAALLAMPKRKWTDRELSAVEQSRFYGRISDAKWDVVTQRKSMQLQAGGGFI